MKKIGIFFLCIIGFVIVFLLSAWITFNVLDGKSDNEDATDNVAEVYTDYVEIEDEAQVENVVDFVPGSVTKITPGLKIEDAIITVEGVSAQPVPETVPQEEPEAEDVVIEEEPEPKAQEAPLVETPKTEEKPKETPKAETPKTEEKPKEEPKVETPKTEEKPKEEPKVEEPKKEEPKVEEAPKAEEPKVEVKPELDPDIQTSDSGL